MKSAGPLEPLLHEARVALGHHLYYLAVMLSLTLPENLRGFGTAGRPDPEKQTL